MAGSRLFLALIFCSLSSIVAKTYFKEKFEDGWNKRWTESTKWKSEDDMGSWKHTAGDWYGNKNDLGIQTGEDARFYGISAELNEPFSNDGLDLVIQYSVKHEQDIDCGGAYIKLLGPDLDADSFGGDSPYQIMFGPDICGSSNRKTHVIFNYNGDNKLIKDEVQVESDQLSHLYTLHVKPDNYFEVFIDDKSVKSGDLESNWDFLPPKEIKDPAVSKPTDWVDNKMIDDPTDVKPDGWDDIPAEIPDPDATMPDDWDEEEDGEWEPPMIDNPEYKGTWKPKKIKNPDYKGPWEHPMIPNPEYTADDKLHFRCNKCTHVGFELWQVKSGTIFDDIIITDSLEEAKAFSKQTFWKKQSAEKKMFDKKEEERREREQKEREEAEKNQKQDDPEEEDDEDEDHDEL